MVDEAGDRDVEPEREPRAGGRGRLVLTVLLGLVALGAVVVAAALWSDRADLEREADRRDDIASVAGSFAEVLLSYDFEDLDASRQRVRDLATPDFADEYVEAFDAGLGVQIESLEATSTASIREVFVSTSTGDTARAIVIADSEIESEAGSRATVGTYLDITLVRLDGRWQVDDVTSVANAGSRLTPAPGTDDDATSTTTTSAP